MFYDSSRRPGRFLEWKVRLFTLGAVSAVMGMATNQRWMTWLAILILAAGLLLRFLPGGRVTAESESDEEDDEEDDEFEG